MNTETTGGSNTDHVDVTITSEEHVALINMAGEKGWRYLRLASNILEAVALRTKSLEGKNISDEPAPPGSFTISVPVAQQAKIALINLVGSQRLAYTTIASHLLKEAIQAEITLRQQQRGSVPTVISK